MPSAHLSAMDWELLLPRFMTHAHAANACIRTLIAPYHLITISLLCLCGSVPPACASDGTSVSGSIKTVEARPRFELSWTAIPDAAYRVQMATDLTGITDQWKTIDVVRAPASSLGPIRWMAPEAMTSRAFYRLSGPDPEIFSVEPAWVDSADPNAALYLVGQCLPTNATVLINGESFTATLDSSGALRVSLLGGALPGGSVISSAIRVMDNTTSNIVATWEVQSPLFYGTELTPEQLQGPPAEPPASPAKKDFKGHVTLLKAFDDDDGDASSVRAFLSKKGYDYYQAQSDLAASGLQNKPAFQENNTQGAMPDAALIHAFLSKKGYDYYQAQSQRSAARGRGAHELKGHVTLIKREMAPGSGVDEDCDGRDDDCDGVFASTGEFRLEEADLVIPGRGLDFAWTRTYRSRTGPTTAQGAGWDFSYNVSLAPQPDGTVLLRTGDGRSNTFYPDGTNGWLRDEYLLTLGDLDRDGYPDVVTFADTGKWTFNPPGTAVAGKLSQIVDRNGNMITLNYDAVGRLSTIVDTLDRTNTVAYNPSGRVESVTDFSGRVVRYEYDSNGDLVACVSPAVTGTPTGNDFPGGKTNRYAYSSGLADDRLNHNLTACIDANGQTWLQVAYHPTNNPASLDFDAVDSVQRGPNREQLRRYAQTPSSKNGFAVMKTIACDAVGNVTECYYDSRQRCLRQLEFSGRSNPGLPVTESDNRPTGKLRADDPDYFETQWTWNPDSLCTRELRPGGDSTEIVHQRVQDHNSSRSNKSSRRHDGDVRVWRERASSVVDTDGDGVAETTELAWYFEYDPRFGSPVRVGNGVIRHGMFSYGPDPFERQGDGSVSGSRVQDHNSSRSNKSSSVLDDGDNTPIIKGSALGGMALRHKHKGWDGLIYGNHRIRPKGWDGTIKGRIDQDCDGFVTRVTDPRGNVTTASYNAQGMLFRVRKRPDLLTQEWDTLLDYNAYGQLTTTTNAADAGGFRRVDTFSYHASGPQAGYLSSIAIDEPGVHLTMAFEYDDRGNLTRCVDPRGNDWLFTYNSLDQLVRSQSPTNATVRCETTHLLYDANDNVVETVSELRDQTDAFVRNVSSLVDYDLLDRCVAVAGQVSPGVFVTNRFEYDSNGRVTAALSPLAVSDTDPHSTVAFEYDERGLLFREIGAPGSGHSPTNEYSYTLNGMRTRINELESKLPKLGLLTYDGFNRPTSYTDPMSNVVSYLYDRNGNLTRVRFHGETNDFPGSAGNRLLAETRYVYDGLDRCVQQVDSFFDIFTDLAIGDGQVTSTFTYAPNGACSSVTDDNGRTTRYAYDSAGRCAQITDPKTNSMQFTYDACDNVTGMTSIERPDSGGAEQSFTRNYTYDALGRCVQTVDNVGNTTVCAFDSFGRVVAQTNPNGVLATMEYDDAWRELKLFVDKNADGTIEPGELRLSRVWDGNSRCVSVTDANTNTTLYAYDSLDRCVTVTEADGTSCHLIWSPRSNLVSGEDANGTTVTNTYDLCDRIIHRDIAARGAAAGTTTFESFSYDGLSRCVAASNDVSLVTFAHDSLGNCVRSTQDGITTTCTFDALGNCTSMTYPSGRVVTGTYSALNELASVTSSAGGGLPPVTLATYAYDGPGRLGRITRPNGVETRIQWNGRFNPPNAGGDFGWRQVSGVSHQESAGARTVLDRRTFAYDHNQNKLTRAQTVPFFLGGPTTTNVFAYDALDRLTQFSRTAGSPDDFFRIYGLDNNGNRQFVSSNGMVAPYVMEPVIPPGDFQMDQYTITPFGSQTFDDNGNLAMRGSPVGALQYVYDYADRLVAVNDLSSGLPAPMATYAYDALGRRIGKTTFATGGLPPVTTLFVHDGNDCDDDDPIEEHENGSLKKTYVIPHVFEQKGRISACKTYAFPHVFDQKGRMMLAAGGGTLHLHTDDLGNALALTDDSGAVVERYDYDDYGLPSFLSVDGAPLTGSDGLPATSSPAGNPFLFRSLEWEAETGFYHGGGGDGFDPKTAKSINNGGMPNRISMNVTVPKQTQGATFGERVNAGLHAAGSAVAQGAYFNPREYTISKLKGEGGRHTPFHNRSILKSYFETGDIPTQDQFGAILDRSAKHTKTGHVTLMK